MVPEINLHTNTPKEAVFAQLKELFAEGEFDELDGLTVNYPDFWFNLRASNTEPVMRLNAEAKTQAQLDEVVAKVTQVTDQ
jgi:phosphomannomutase